MGSLIISLVACTILILIDYYLIKKETAWGNPDKSIGVITGLSIIYFILVFPLMHVCYGRVEVQHLEYEKEIVAMSDTVGVHGSISGNFLLMSGSVDSGLEYNFYVKDERGGYILRTASAQSSRIIEREKGPYTVTKYNYRFERKESDFFFSTRSDIRRYEWVFVIPPKSVKEQFNLDME